MGHCLMSRPEINTSGQNSLQDLKHLGHILFNILKDLGHIGHCLMSNTEINTSGHNSRQFSFRFKRLGLYWSLLDVEAQD